MQRRHYSSLFAVAALLLIPAKGWTKGKHAKSPSEQAPADRIQVVGHLAASSMPVTRFLTTEHYGHEYLYAEHGAGQTLTLIDLSDARHPVIAAEMVSSLGGDENIVAAVGNAALVLTRAGSGGQAETKTGASTEPGTFRIMSFANPLHPAVQQEFTGVTAMAADDKRGLIFLANDKGIWILQQQFAVDPAKAKLEAEIEHSIYDTP